MADLSRCDRCRMATRHLAFTHYVACPEAEGYSEPERTSKFLKRSNPLFGRTGGRSRTTSGGDGIVDVDGERKIEQPRVCSECGSRASGSMSWPQALMA